MVGEGDVIVDGFYVDTKYASFFSMIQLIDLHHTNVVAILPPSRDRTILTEVSVCRLTESDFLKKGDVSKVVFYEAFGILWIRNRLIVFGTYLFGVGCRDSSDLDHRMNLILKSGWSGLTR